MVLTVDKPVSESVLAELRTKFEDFRIAWGDVPISLEDFEAFGPVEHFRGTFCRRLARRVVGHQRGTLEGWCGGEVRRVVPLTEAAAFATARPHFPGSLWSAATTRVAAGATDVKAHAVISNNSVEARTTTQQATGLMTVAVVGLGAMGLAMARRLSSVFAVRGFDPVSERKALALAAGLEVADLASAAASGGDFVVLAVRDIRQVDDALFGPSGVVEGLAARSIVILTSRVGAAGLAASPSGG